MPVVAERVDQGATQMPAADRLGMDDAHAGKGKARLGVGGAERRQPVELIDQRDRAAAGGEHPVDASSGTSVSRASPSTKPLGQKLSQLVEPVGRDGEPGRHRMAAAVEQQPRLARRDHRRAQRQTGDRAARAPADPTGERDDAGRALDSAP